MRKNLRFVASSVLVRALVGCSTDTATDGSIDGSIDSSEEGATVDDTFAWDSECTTPSEDLPTDGLICADSGLRPVTDGFSFENWGGPVDEDAVTLNTVAELFGVEAVCSELQGDMCTPVPAAVQWIESMNESIEGGRCEGMAVLSQRFAVGLNTPSELQDGAI
ncbi:MAG: hypothetical protein ACKOI2_12540, partial [Actinomycetota bacterium]